jgi:uncharacterized protein YndB with AHSA1/START domain
MTAALGYQLDRIVTIKATREIVFGFFTDSTRWASWWGPGSSIESTPGGRVLILHPGGVETSGEVLEVEPPARIVFTYGFASGTPFPPGSSRVTIRLQSVDEGTQLHLTHEFPTEAGREEHVQGWRYQLSLFANLVANEVNRQAERQVDLWYEAWSSDDGAARRESLSRIATSQVTFNDRFSHTEGLADLGAHLDAARRHMAGLTLQRTGAVRHCQGCGLSDWIAVGADGQEKARGTNVFTFDATGRIAAVTGFWQM